MLRADNLSQPRSGIPKRSEAGGSRQNMQISALGQSQWKYKLQLQSNVRSQQCGA